MFEHIVRDAHRTRARANGAGRSPDPGTSWLSRLHMGHARAKVVKKRAKRRKSRSTAHRSRSARRAVRYAVYKAVSMRGHQRKRRIENVIVTPSMKNKAKGIPNSKFYPQNRQKMKHCVSKSANACGVRESSPLTAHRVTDGHVKYVVAEPTTIEESVWQKTHATLPRTIESCELTHISHTNTREKLRGSMEQRRQRQASPCGCALTPRRPT